MALLLGGDLRTRLIHVPLKFYTYLNSGINLSRCALLHLELLKAKKRVGDIGFRNTRRVHVSMGIVIRLL